MEKELQERQELQEQLQRVFKEHQDGLLTYRETALRLILAARGDIDAVKIFLLTTNISHDAFSRIIHHLDIFQNGNCKIPTKELDETDETDETDEPELDEADLDVFDQDCECIGTIQIPVRDIDEVTNNEMPKELEINGITYKPQF